MDVTLITAWGALLAGVGAVAAALIQAIVAYRTEKREELNRIKAIYAEMTTVIIVLNQLAQVEADTGNPVNELGKRQNIANFERYQVVYGRLLVEDICIVGRVNTCIDEYFQLFNSTASIPELVDKLHEILTEMANSTHYRSPIKRWLVTICQRVKKR
jgi:hypothetical protein